MVSAKWPLITATLLLASPLPAQVQSVSLVPSGSAPEESLLKRPAQLSLVDAPFLQALETLSRTSGVRLAYSASLLPDDRSKRVSCPCESATVAEALDVLIAATPLGYREVDDHVVIFPSLTPQDGPRISLAAIPLGTTRASPHRRPLPAQDSITGVVVSSRTGEPVGGAQISLVGTARGTLSDSQGRFNLSDLTGTEVTLRIERIGYRTHTQVVQVGELDIRIPLTDQAIGLEQIVVTATGEQRLRERGSSVARINAESITMESPVSNVSELMAGRAAGVFVRTVAGTSVGGSRIRIRGSSSLSLANEPLIYIDGVRMNSDPSSISFSTNGQLPSRISDINPREIESIDVIKGPSASTMYGTEAANGVILITTKMGSATREAQWQMWSEAGRITEANEYPLNYESFDAAGNPCPLTSIAAGSCSQSELRTFNLLMNPETTPFRTGARNILGGSVQGAAADVRYFVSGEMERQRGVYAQDRVRRVNLRGNFNIRPIEMLGIDVHTGYVSSDLDLFTEGGTTLGPVTNGMVGRARPDGWFQFSPDQLAQIDANQHVDRFIGSTTVQLDPLDWLQFRGSLGLDAVSRDDQRLFPVGAFPAPRAAGVRDTGRNNTLKYTANFLTRFDVDLRPDVSSRSSVGVQYFIDRSRTITATGEQLIPGSNSLATAAQIATSEQTVETRALGIFFDQQFGYRDRLFVSGGLRADDHSNFGRQLDLVTYPALSLSWVVSEESFFPTDGPFNSLRLRAAWGQSGSQPGAADGLRFFNAFASTTPEGRDEIGSSFEGGSLGNPLLKPERSSEVEVGFDVGLFDERLALSVGYYDKRTVDALVFREVAPSVGATAGRWENLGETRNQGFEGLIEAELVDRPNWDLGLVINAAYNSNNLVTLGEGVAPITVGTGQRHVEDFPLGGYWFRTIDSFEDANGDGIIAPEEIMASDTAVFLGEVYPPFQASVQPTATLFDRIRLSGLVDLRYGHKLYNFSEGFRCNQANARGRNDLSAPLDEQARCVAHALLGVQGGFVQDAGFTSLRELSATVSLPEQWTGPTRSTSVTLSGQNLATWTSYPGVHPDINARGLNFNTLDFFQPAPTRHLVVRVNVTF